jgi:hypothetical protein
VRQLYSWVQVLATDHCSGSQVDVAEPLRERIEINVSGFVTWNDDTSAWVVHRGETEFVREPPRRTHLGNFSRNHALPLSTAHWRPARLKLCRSRTAFPYAPGATGPSRMLHSSAPAGHCRHSNTGKTPRFPGVNMRLDCNNVRQFTGCWPLYVGQALPNPSLKRSANGRPPGPGRRYVVHCRLPGPGGLPSATA